MLSGSTLVCSAASKLTLPPPHLARYRLRNFEEVGVNPAREQSGVSPLPEVAELWSGTAYFVIYSQLSFVLKDDPQSATWGPVRSKYALRYTVVYSSIRYNYTLVEVLYML